MRQIFSNAEKHNLGLKSKKENLKTKEYIALERFLSKEKENKKSGD